MRSYSTDQVGNRRSGPDWTWFVAPCSVYTVRRGEPRGVVNWYWVQAVLVLDSACNNYWISASVETIASLIGYDPMARTLAPASPKA